MLIDELIEQLIALRGKRADTSAQAFETILERLAPLTSSLSHEQVKRLLSLLNDGYQQQDVMWSLLHLIESAELVAYVDAFVETFTTMQTSGASEWAETIACRILNAGDLDEQLLDCLQRSSPATIAAFTALLEELTHSKSDIAINAERFADKLKS